MSRILFGASVKLHNREGWYIFLGWRTDGRMWLCSPSEEPLRSGPPIFTMLPEDVELFEQKKGRGALLTNPEP